MTSDWDEMVGKVIRQAREDIGMSQRALAKRLGKDPSAITRLERGTLSLRLEDAMDISRELQVTLDELVGHEAWEQGRDEEVSHLRLRVAELERRQARIANLLIGTENDDD